MSGKIVIERLEFRGRCGVTPEERARPQPLAVDLELDCRFESAGQHDHLAHTIDYTQVAHRVVEIGTEKEANLLETLAERLMAMLFREFPIDGVKLWIRKLHPPITFVTSSVGIILERTRSTLEHRPDRPSRPAGFLAQHLARLPKGKALDLASGSGRHALFLASHGYQVDAVDRDEQALAQLAAEARAQRLESIVTKTMDLEKPTPPEPQLGKETYDVIVVFFYLYRSLFPYIVEALKPGGVLVYETFTIDNYFHHKHPRRWEFCLAHNELLRLTSSLQVLHYDEGPHEGGQGPERIYTAQLVAQKPTRQPGVL